ncbi:MAG: MFS transporter [Spirochaetes bacterium]|nr:MFS transporter [Spirochaetota bacterium]
MPQIKSLKNNLIYLFISEFILNFNVLVPFLTLFFVSRGLNPQYILITWIVYSASSIVFEVPTGLVADYFGAKISILIGSFLNVAVGIGFYFASGPLHFYLISIIMGLMATFFSGAMDALIYETLKLQNRETESAKVFGWIYSAAEIAAVAATLVGFFLGVKGTDQDFKLLIVISIIAAVFQIFFILPIICPSKINKYRVNPLNNLKSGFKTIFQQPPLIFIFINTVLVFIGAIAVKEFQQLVLTDAGLVIKYLGLFYGVLGLLRFLFSNLSGKISNLLSSPIYMFVTGFIVLIAILLVIIFKSNLYLLLILIPIISVFSFIREPVYSSLANEYIPTENRATTHSLLSIIDSLLDVVVVSIICVTLADHYIYIYIGAAVLVLLGIVFPIIPKKSKQE